MNRRAFSAAASLAAGWPALSWAAFPDQPIRLIVLNGAGTATDNIARFLANAIGKELNTPVVVENKPGAGGTIAADFVSKAPADGYTVLLTNGGHFTAPWLYAKLPYDAVADFTAVAQVAQSPQVFSVGQNSPYGSMTAVLAAARKQPGKVTFASIGQGSSAHLAATLLWSMAGVDLKHIPYKTLSQSTLDVSAGNVDVAITGITGVLPLARAGRLRPIAITSNARSELLPAVPTVAELGFARGYDVLSPIFALARVGTPDAAVQVIASAMTKAASGADFKKLCANEGLDVAIRGPGDLQSAMPKELERWKGIVALAGIKPE